MPSPRLTGLEMQIMEALWSRGMCSIREIQETFPAKGRPAYTTVQAALYRLEAKKKAVRRVKKIGRADIFEATLSREEAQGTLIDELLALLGGHAKPVMAHFVKTGKLTMDEVKETRKMLRKLARKDETK